MMRMKEFIQEFKAFAMRGNVVDLAVAVVIGAAFGKIVTSLVENIVTPLMGVILGGVDFSTLAFTLGEAKVVYGAFLQSVFDFIIIAFAIFMALKVIARLKRKEETEVAKETAPVVSEEILLLREIRDSLKNNISI